MKDAANPVETTRSFDELTGHEKADFLGDLFRSSLPILIQTADDDAHRAVTAKIPHV